MTGALAGAQASARFSEESVGAWLIYGDGPLYLLERQESNQSPRRRHHVRSRRQRPDYLRDPLGEPG